MGQELLDGYTAPPATPAERQALEEKREVYRKEWREKVLKITDDFGVDQDRRRASKNIQALVGQMEAVTNQPAFDAAKDLTTKEKLCLEFAQELLQQLQQ